MALLRHTPAWLACLFVAHAAVPARAQAPPDPLRLVPAEADLVAKVEQPRQLLQTVLSLGAVQRTLELDPVREFYDSTNARRFYQLLTHVEKKLGADRFELLDRLTGGGVVLAVKVAPDPAPALLVAQARDEELLHRFVSLATDLISQELARQESKDRLEKTSYRNVEGFRAGKQLHVAVAGSALLVANNERALHLAIDLHLDGAGKSIAGNPTLTEAHRILPGRPLAWAWLNLEPIRALPQFKEVVPALELNPVTGPFVAAWLDAAKRSPFLCAGLSRQEDGFLATVRLPRGRDGMAPAAAVYLPGDGDAAPPLLEPRNVQFSSTYYLDLAKLWEQRDKIFSKEARKGLEAAEKNSGRFLGGIKLGTLLNQAGAHQRVIAVEQSKSSIYKRQPKQPVGAFAVIQEMRDPAFGRSMDTLIRAGALAASTQFRLKMVEEKYGDCTVVSYRFPEDRALKGDVNDIRFGFSPCYVQVGNQFVASSTVELARELVDMLRAESAGRTGGLAARMKGYASGAAAQLRSIRDQLITRAVLGQAVSLERARQQVDALIDLVEHLGHADVESVYGRSDYRLDMHLVLGK
jgi:hypothetical protein